MKTINVDIRKEKFRQIASKMLSNKHSIFAYFRNKISKEELESRGVKLG